MRKYGLLSYQNYNFKRVINIGDYIQSLAAKQFLPQVDYLIDRESLNQYDGSPVNMIMNGWYMHNPSHWPPSNKITPFYIALHINSSCEEEMLNNESIKHFKKYEPIGCRDERTAKTLQKKGIDCYFSGCLTTTLGNTYKIDINTERTGIYFVDPYIPYIDNPHTLASFKDAALLFFSGLKFSISKRKLISKIANELYKDGYGISLKARFVSKKLIYSKFYQVLNLFIPRIFAIIFLALYSKKFSWEILEKANYIRHLYLANNFNNEDEKFELAEDLVNKYAKAELVITSRIHSALPCLALGTPHIYTAHPHNLSTRASKRHNSRFEGLANLFNNLNYEKRRLHGISEGLITSATKIKNKNEHISLVKNLNNKCRGLFI